MKPKLYITIIITQVEDDDDPPIINPKYASDTVIPYIQQPPKQAVKQTNIKEWLNINNLSDLEYISNYIQLKGLLNIEPTQLSPLLSSFGLSDLNVARVIQAVEMDPSNLPNVNNQPIQRPPEMKQNEQQQSSRQQQHQYIFKSPPKHQRKKFVKPKPKPEPIYEPKQWEYKVDIDDDKDDELEYDSDISIDDIKDDGKHPVYPLVMPNNCTYDARTGRMRVNHQKARRKLITYEPVKFIFITFITFTTNHNSSHIITNLTQKTK